jgi:hypothetical protein
MSKGKYYSLEEAREASDVKGFAKANPSKGSKDRLDDTLKRMAFDVPQKKPLPKS